MKGPEEKIEAMPEELKDAYGGMFYAENGGYQAAGDPNLRPFKGYSTRSMVERAFEVALSHEGASQRFEGLASQYSSEMYEAHKRSAEYYKASSELYLNLAAYMEEHLLLPVEEWVAFCRDFEKVLGKVRFGQHFCNTFYVPYSLDQAVWEMRDAQARSYLLLAYFRRDNL